MRISGLSINLKSISIIHSSASRYDKLLTQASSGQKIQKGHEDPVLAQKAIVLENSLKQNEQYTKNINDAKSILDYTEGILAQGNDMLTRVKALAIQAGSDTMTPESREAMAREIDQIILEFVNMGNQQYNGKYIFAGTHTTTKPFEVTGNPPTGITYHGNDNEISYNILDNYNLVTNIPGSRAFEGLINDLITIRDDIRDGNLDDISNVGLDMVERNIDNMIALRTELGAKSNITDTTLERVKSMDLELKSNYSSLMGVNLAENSVEVAGVELSYQASLSVVGKLHQMSLVNYLK